MNHHSMESPRIGRKLKQGHSKCEVTILACKKKLQIQGFVWCVSYHVACIWFELIWTTGLSTALQKTRLITMKRKVFAEKDLRAGCSKRLIWRVVMSLCSAILLQHWPHQLPDQDKDPGFSKELWIPVLYARRLFCEVLCFLQFFSESCVAGAFSFSWCHDERMAYMLHWCRKLRWSLYQCFSTLTTVREKEPQRRLRWKEEQLSSNIQTKIISCFCFCSINVERNVQRERCRWWAKIKKISKPSQAQIRLLTGWWSDSSHCQPRGPAECLNLPVSTMVLHVVNCSWDTSGIKIYDHIDITLHIMYHLYIFEIYCSIPFLFLSLSLSYLFIALPQATKLLLLL